jgi:hypothetical protein
MTDLGICSEYDAADLAHSATAAAHDPTRPRHPFAHLAPGPYRFLGLETYECREDANRAAERDGGVFTTNLCGGACDHCGTSISDVYRFRGSDGTRFKLGSSCVLRMLEPTSEHRHDPAIAAAKRAIAKANTAKRHARDAAKISALVATMADPAAVARLAALPSPKAHRAERGETLADHVAWVLGSPLAGVKARLAAAKAVRLALA